LLTPQAIFPILAEPAISCNGSNRANKGSNESAA